MLRAVVKTFYIPCLAVPIPANASGCVRQNGLSNLEGQKQLCMHVLIRFS